MMTARIWQSLGLRDVRLEINTLGTSEERSAYREVLVEYLSAHQDQLDEDSQRRLRTNPLRILDTKNPEMQQLVSDAPQLINHLDESSLAHFERLRLMLDSLGIVYVVNPRLVRGLDYYCHTVFEWITDSLGAQGTICAGGRYDGLVEQLGGKPTPACGFAMGIERLVTMLEEQASSLPDAAPDVYIINVGESAELMAIQLSEVLHDQYTTLRVLRHCGGGSFKSQMKRADKSGARIAILIGDDEVRQDRVGIKFLRENREQLQLSYDEVSGFLANEFN
jgi:histidyl-tRNA synthetase